MDNINLMTCKECGSIEFERVEVVKVTAFYEKEYSSEGFERANPNFFSVAIKLRCHKCGKLYGE